MSCSVQCLLYNRKESIKIFFPTLEDHQKKYIWPRCQCLCVDHKGIILVETLLPLQWLYCLHTQETVYLIFRPNVCTVSKEHTGIEDNCERLSVCVCKSGRDWVKKETLVLFFKHGHNRHFFIRFEDSRGCFWLMSVSKHKHIFSVLLRKINFLSLKS